MPQSENSLVDFPGEALTRQAGDPSQPSGTRWYTDCGNSAGTAHLYIVANGEYPGSRYQGMVDAPAPADWSSQSRLLSAMMIYEQLSATASQASRLALTCAIAPVLGLGKGTWTNEEIGLWYQSGCAVEIRLQKAQKQLKEVAEWRGIELQVAHVRAQGKFLRMGDPIPLQKPKSSAEALSDLYKMSRRTGFSMTVANQDLPSMKEALG